ncbi:hypothetical protein ACFYQA_18110 [Streptomyces sp. NPDC005774]|uniref:hypothetical protein n=1 Tax=Streptomyces sp. NPDC005774 TaxID=3364728 RepID=UPI0036AEBF86
MDAQSETIAMEDVEHVEDVLGAAHEAELVRDDHPWDRTLLLHQAAKEAPFGVLGRVPAQQDRRHGQQRPGGPVQQPDDHWCGIPTTAEESRTRTPTCSDDFTSPTGARTGS